MEPLNPLLGIQEAVLRANFPEQRLTVEEALRMYTVDAAYCSGEENVKGSIEEGKLADLTVLSDDPMIVPTNEIKDVKVAHDNYRRKSTFIPTHPPRGLVNELSCFVQT